jgi:hypothetical protein
MTRHDGILPDVPFRRDTDDGPSREQATTA